jgi:hypothetical protein
MNLLLKDQRGQSLIQVVIAVGIMGILMMSMTSFFEILNKQQNKNNLAFQAGMLRNNLVAALNNSVGWKNTTTQSANNFANGVMLDCLNNGKPCTTDQSTDLSAGGTPVGYSGGAPTDEGVLIRQVLDSTGTVILDSTNPNSGYTPQGTSCSTFNAATGSGDDSCPLRFEVHWWAKCNSVANTCVNAQAELQIVVIYNPRKQVQAFNPANYGTPKFLQGQEPGGLCWQLVGTSLYETCSLGVGIGTSEPQSALDIAGSAQLFIRNGPGGVLPPAAGQGLKLEFANPGTGALGQIQAWDYALATPKNLALQSIGGFVGIGTGNPKTTLEVNPGNVFLTRTINDVSGPSIIHRKAHNGGIVQNGDEVGYMRFDGYDGANYQPAANIGVVVDGTPGANDMPGALSFKTTPDGSNALTERMRITNKGYVGIGTQNPPDTLSVFATDANPVVHIENTNSSAKRTAAVVVANYGGAAASGVPYVLLQSSRGSNSAPSPSVANDTVGEIHFYGMGSTTFQKAATIISTAQSTFTDASFSGNLLFATANAGDIQTRMTITSSGSVGIGTTLPNQKLVVSGNVAAQGFFYTSDRRAKTNITPLAESGSVLQRLDSLHGVYFDWKNSGEKSIGVIAQDVARDFPELVDRRDDQHWTVNYGGLVAVELEAMKELRELVLASKNQIDALKQQNELLKAEISSLRTEFSSLRRTPAKAKRGQR